MKESIKKRINLLDRVDLIPKTKIILRDLNDKLEELAENGAGKPGPKGEKGDKGDPGSAEVKTDGKTITLNGKGELQVGDMNEFKYQQNHSKLNINGDYTEISAHNTEKLRVSESGVVMTTSGNNKFSVSRHGVQANNKHVVTSINGVEADIEGRVVLDLPSGETVHVINYSDVTSLVVKGNVEKTKDNITAFLEDFRQENKVKSGDRMETSESSEYYLKGRYTEVEGVVIFDGEMIGKTELFKIIEGEVYIPLILPVYLDKRKWPE